MLDLETKLTFCSRKCHLQVVVVITIAIFILIIVLFLVVVPAVIIVIAIVASVITIVASGPGLLGLFEV